MRDWQCLIGDRWMDAQDGGRIEVFDPATEEQIATLSAGSAADIDLAVKAARAAFEGPWSELVPVERARLLFRIADAIVAHVDELARLETLDAGKPLQLSRKEVLNTARYFEYYAGAVDKLQGDTIPLGPDYLDFTLREPMGVTAHVVPWNMPLNMVGRSVAPALATGNTAVVKPSEFTSLTALRLGELMLEVGLPGGVYNIVTGTGPTAGMPLCTHPGIDAITFTGSVKTGREIMRYAAEHIKPLVLELGGKSPHIIFADADLDLAAAEVIKGIYANCGQICSAGSRLLVEQSFKAPLLERVLARAEAMKLGAGLDEPDMGPLVSAEHHARVLGYIQTGQEQGASLLCGGERAFEKGYFVKPTIFDGVSPQMRIAQEEIFGPVLSVLSFENETEALALANDVPYGLVAGIFTNDLNRALSLTKRLKAGQIYVNEYFAGGVETPFGGWKQSGFGREKGLIALDHYTQVKNVAIRIRH